VSVAVLESEASEPGAVDGFGEGEGLGKIGRWGWG
jgi:hypothetical protein